MRKEGVHFLGRRANARARCLPSHRAIRLTGFVSRSLYQAYLRSIGGMCAPECVRGRQLPPESLGVDGIQVDVDHLVVSSGDPPEYLDLLANHERTGGIHIQGAFFRELPANACHAVDSGPSVGC